jgi:3-deoxy-D-manno-octulosonic-acid transferase
MSRLPASLLAYRLASGLAEPLAPALLRARARRGKEDPIRLEERLGVASRPRPTGPLVWLHGASVGEALSLIPLAEDLMAARPDLILLVTAGTRTAAELLARRLPAGVIHQYAPVDGPAAARRFLEHWRPDLGVFVESELWPNLLIGARQRGVRMALLSAKLSDASLRGWARAPAAARALFAAFDLVLAQDQRAADRLTSLGAAVSGIADLKFGAAPLPADPAALASLKSEIGARPVILAASTHPGEDEVMITAFRALDDHDALLVIAPRHPDRGPDIAAMIEREGPGVSLQSRGDLIGASRVRVADAMGELGVWFRLARLAVIGGSLVDGVGGHNPLEAARLDCPFISGPHVANWRGAYAELIGAQATALVAADDLGDWMKAAIGGDPKLGAMSERAKAFVADRDGQARAVTPRLLALLP